MAGVGLKLSGEFGKNFLHRNVLSGLMLCFMVTGLFGDVPVWGQSMRLSGRVIGLLKEYMHDMVEQAKQEEAAIQSFGYASQPYRADQAISDLLAILDDRIESEGVQVGLPVEFLHEMWTLCNEAGGHIGETVWLKKNLEETPPSKARTRELTYRALIEYLESQPE